MKREFLIFTSLLLLYSNVFAGLIVTPARCEAVIEKNSEGEFYYTVTNGFDKPVNVDITIKNWNNSLENKNIPINSWLIVPFSSVKLEPGESKQINYKIQSGDLEGSLSGMISFTVKSPDYSGINLMTSVPVYMTIDGTQKIDFEIEKIDLQKSKDTYFSTFEVKNNGNTYIRLSGNLKITDGKKIIAESKISELSPVYPDLKRAFSEALPSLKKGKYTLNISLNALGKTVEKSILIRVNKYGEISY